MIRQNKHQPHDSTLACEKRTQDKKKGGCVLYVGEYLAWVLQVVAHGNQQETTTRLGYNWCRVDT